MQLALCVVTSGKALRALASFCIREKFQIAEGKEQRPESAELHVLGVQKLRGERPVAIC